MDTRAGRKDAEIPANPGGQGGDYRFLDFTLDPRRQLLIHGADEIRLRPRTYDVLVHLVRHAGRVVGKSELMESVWKDVAVTDDSLVQSLMEIRRALGQAEGIVKTVRGRGYLFDIGVEMVPKDAIPTQGQDHHRDQSTDSSARDETSTNRPGLSSALVVVAVIAGIAAIVWWIGLSARRQASAPPPAGTIRSIAVLPLQNQSRDQEQEYFADGITDELITQLGKIGSLRVISRTSVMRLKGTRKALAEIAQDLNVDAVVEGSVARSAERVRVTAQVIQVNPEKLLWAERYDRALGDIVMLQGELAREITNAIRIALNADEQTRLGNVRPVNRDAYRSAAQRTLLPKQDDGSDDEEGNGVLSRGDRERFVVRACFRKPVGCVHKLCAFGDPTGSSSCTRSLSAGQGGGQQSSRNRRYPRRSACDSRSHQVSVRPRLG